MLVILRFEMPQQYGFAEKCQTLLCLMIFMVPENSRPQPPRRRQTTQSNEAQVSAIAFWKFWKIGKQANRVPGGCFIEFAVCPQFWGLTVMTGSAMVKASLRCRSAVFRVCKGRKSAAPHRVEEIFRLVLSGRAGCKSGPVALWGKSRKPTFPESKAVAKPGRPNPLSVYDAHRLAGV